jgi:capsule polysaccharide modification protein KpsS
VPHDAALTIRSPEYLDQYALLDYLARIIPPDHTLVFKEHPALVGAVNHMRVKKLLQSYDNIKMINPVTPNYDVMKKALMVVTVNSKSGAEAMLLGKPVVVLGDAFYATSSLVTKVESLKEIRSILPQLLFITEQIKEQEIKKYFQCVWDQSWPGEIYSRDPMQIGIMASSLSQYITASL